MEIQQIKSILEKKLELNHISINGDGKHFNITVVSKLFENMNKIKRHQFIYKILFKYITNNIIHSISINAFSSSEWLFKKNSYKI